MTIKKPLGIKQPQVAKFIHHLRCTVGLTQEQFAVALGVTYGTINRWEKGRSKPSPLAMQKIEGILQQMGQKGTDLLSQYFSED